MSNNIKKGFTSLGSSMSFSPAMEPRYGWDITPASSDREALAGDWRKVCNDMHQSMKVIAHEAYGLTSSK